MLLDVTELCAEPTHEQIAGQMAARLLRGDPPGGTELEPARVIARAHRVSVSAVRRAYRALEAEGLIERAEDGRPRVAQLGAGTRADLGRRLHTETLDRARLRFELDTARQIQSMLLPTALPDNVLVRVAASSSWAGTLGGDFYDCVQEEDGPLAVVVADASGKGLPAALLACQVQAWLKSELASDTKLPRILARLNRQLVRFTPGNRFVTLVCARLCCETGELALTSAGHERAIRIAADGGAELLPAGGPPLGMLDAPHYPTLRARLERGDLLALYSDGVTETTDSRGVEFGNGRLVHQLIDTRHAHPRLALERLIEALERFSGGAPLDDDRTVLILKRN